MIETVFSKLSKLDVNVYDIGVGRTRWEHGSVDSFSGDGRKNDLLFYMISGEREYHIDGKQDFKLCKNDIIFIPVTACYLSKVTDKAGSEGIYVDFKLSTANDLVYINEPFKVIGDGERYFPYFNSLVESGTDKLSVKSGLLRILADISKNEEVSYFSNGEFSSIYAAIELIEKHPENSADVASLAKLCCQSETGFREKFKRYTGGESPLEYRNRLRIERADELIRSGSIPIAQIAVMLGFYDTSHFYRMYKRYRGKTPGGIV